MKPVKLLNIDKEAFGRGWIFRCNKAEYPYESKVDFIIREEGNSPGNYALMVISGFKAGLTLVNFPAECILPDKGISKKWLIENWAKWIYPECPIEQVDIYRIDIGN
jgi:hypothetical protein